VDKRRELCSIHTDVSSGNSSGCVAR
jgi:hypothetical protein